MDKTKKNKDSYVQILSTLTVKREPPFLADLLPFVADFCFAAFSWFEPRKRRNSLRDWGWRIYTSGLVA